MFTNYMLFSKTFTLVIRLRFVTINIGKKALILSLPGGLRASNNNEAWLIYVNVVSIF